MRPYRFAAKGRRCAAIAGGGCGGMALDSGRWVAVSVAVQPVPSGALVVGAYFHRVRVSSRLNAARAAKNKTTTSTSSAAASKSIEPGSRVRIPISDDT